MSKTIFHLGSNYFPLISGSAIRLDNLLKPLSENFPFFNLNIIAELDSPNLPYQRFDKIRVFYINKKQSLITKILQYRRVLRNQKIDIIHSHNLRMSLIGFSLLPLCKQILEIHSPQELSFFKKTIAQFVIKKAVKIIVLSKSAKEYFIEKFRLDSNKIEVIYNGRPEIREMSRHDFKNKKQYILGYFGGFEPWDGIYQLVEVFNNLLKIRQNIKLILVGGGGADFEKVKKYIEENKLQDKIIIQSMVRPEEINQYYQMIDIFVLPRLKTLATETAVPLKILEAMAYGLPIIATKVSGLTEVLTDGLDSILVEPNNKQALRQTINQLLDDPEKMEELSKNVQATIKKWPTWQESAKKLYKIYYQILSK